MIKQEIRTQIRIDLVNWFKENYKQVQIRRHILKYIVRSLTHEVIHYKIYEKLGNGIKTEIIINMIKNNLSFRCNFKCRGIYPLKYNLPIYYPIYIFIEFVHIILDIIDGIVRLSFLSIMECLKYFVKTLLILKAKKQITLRGNKDAKSTN